MYFATAALILASYVAASPVGPVPSTTTYYTTEWIKCGCSTESSSSTSVVTSVLEIPSISEILPEPTTTLTTTVYFTVSQHLVPTTTGEIVTEPLTESDISAEAGVLFAGEAAQYEVGSGACGWTNTNDEHVAAIGHVLYDQFPENGDTSKSVLCGRKIRVNYEGKSLELGVVSRIQDGGPYDLQLSPSAFSELAGSSNGKINVEWEWI